MMRSTVLAGVVAACVGFAGDAAVAAGKAGETSLMSALGTIAFPNSGKPAAQDPFLTGVKAFYSF
ncbi:MAG: hypothetical protein SFV21_19965, partial [Rhodospirillaceae bacterium]|nr:hypothetical protein [Rhodospirillaceae bacterium]